MAIEMTKRYPNLSIWVNDLYEPLYLFWLALRDDGDYLYKELIQLKQRYSDHGSAKQLFLDAKEKVNEKDLSYKDRAVAFYIINKCSFSGLTESSSFSPQASDSNFSAKGIENLKHYSRLIKNWKITNEDYAVLVDDCLARGEIKCDDNTFIYVDPPYNIKDNLYGHKGAMHKGFDHARFADVMDDTMGNVMISYNNHPDIVQRFEEWHQYDFAHTYTMRSTGTYMIDQTKRRELICLNYGKYRSQSIA
jgi:DNA adenine methylase